MIVYMDEIILTRNDMDEIIKIKQALAKEFEVKNLGSLRYFFGMKVARSNKDIYFLMQIYFRSIKGD